MQIYNKTYFDRAAPMLILTTLLAVIVAAAPIIVFAQQAQNATQNTTQGFGGPPSGSLTAIRHVFDDPRSKGVAFLQTQ
jgi:hypothetical protein